MPHGTKVMNNAGETQSAQAQWFGALEADSIAQLFPYEPFVDEHVVARFLQIPARRVLEMARKDQIPAHPLGRTRKTWRFRLSEIDAHFSASATIVPAVPGTQERKRLG